MVANLDTAARDKRNAAMHVCSLVALFPVDGRTLRAELVVEMMQLREPVLAEIAAAFLVQVVVIFVRLCWRLTSLSIVDIIDRSGPRHSHQTILQSSRATACGCTACGWTDASDPTWLAVECAPSPVAALPPTAV